MNETVIGIMARTTAAKFRHLPVVEESRLAGIVSIGDVMKWRLDELKHEFARASLAPAVSRWTRSRRWRKLRAELHRIRKILPKMKVAPLQQPFDLGPSR